MGKEKENKQANIIIDVPVKFKIIDVKKANGKMLISAYVSIFGNIDLSGDIIQKGAFAESLLVKLPKGVWSHNWDQPIAKTISAVEDDKGLLIEAEFIAGVQQAEEAYRLIKGGVIDEFSIGFMVLDDEYQEDGVRVIKKARLYEWSPVLVGANPKTELVSIKSKNKVKFVDYVRINEKSKTVELFYNENGNKKSEVLKMSDKFIKYKRDKQALKTKVATNHVEGKATQRKILRIRQVARKTITEASKTIKANEYLLKIIN